MNAHNIHICFHGEIRKCLPDTHSYLDLCNVTKTSIFILMTAIFCLTNIS